MNKQNCHGIFPCYSDKLVQGKAVTCAHYDGIQREHRYSSTYS